MAVDIVCGKEIDVNAMNTTVGHIPAGDTPDGIAYHTRAIGSR